MLVELGKPALNSNLFFGNVCPLGGGRFPRRPGLSLTMVSSFLGKVHIQAQFTSCLKMADRPQDGVPPALPITAPTFPLLDGHLIVNDGCQSWVSTAYGDYEIVARLIA